MRLTRKPNSAKKELSYYLKQYELAVIRHNYWRTHGVRTEQTALMRDKSSETAKVHLNSAVMKYLVHLNASEVSPKVRNRNLQNIVQGFVSAFEKNGLQREVAGNKGKTIEKVLYSVIRAGKMLDLRHTPEERPPVQDEIELEYKDTVAHLFKNPNVAKDASRVILNEFEKIGV